LPANSVEDGGSVAVAKLSRAAVDPSSVDAWAAGAVDSSDAGLLSVAFGFAVDLEVTRDFDFDGETGSLVLVAFVREPALARVPFAAAAKPGAVPLPLPLVPVVMGFGFVVEEAFFVDALDFADLVFAGRVWEILEIMPERRGEKKTYDEDGGLLCDGLSDGYGADRSRCG
jgi:hypothetical protein